MCVEVNYVLRQLNRSLVINLSFFKKREGKTRNGAP